MTAMTIDTVDAVTRREGDHGEKTRDAPMSRALTPEDVADELEVSARTVRRWCEAGEMPATKAGPKLWKIEREAFERWKARR